MAEYLSSSFSALVAFLALLVSSLTPRLLDSSTMHESSFCQDSSDPFQHPFPSLLPLLVGDHNFCCF